MCFLVTSVVLVFPFNYMSFPGKKGEVLDFAFRSTDTLCSFTLLINAYNDAEKEWQEKAYH